MLGYVEWLTQVKYWLIYIPTVTSVGIPLSLHDYKLIYMYFEY